MTDTPVSFTHAVKPVINKSYSGKSITETLTNGFFTVDRKWVVKYWNKAAEKLLGVEARNIVGKNLWEEFAAIIPIECYSFYQNAFLQNIPVHFEEYWGEMGAWFDVITYHCEDTFSVSFKSSNSPDSGYPDNPAQRLKTLTELYKFVTEITNDCLWEWDLRTEEIFWIDGGHKRVFGYQIENALIPQSFWESRLHPDDKIAVLTKLEKIVTDGITTFWEDDYRFLKANGEYAFVHDRGHIIYGEDKQASRIIGATQDITEKVLLEKKLVQEKITKQKEITDAVLTALEIQRENIGNELQENLNQTLIAAKWYIQMSRTHENKRDSYLDKSNNYLGSVIEKLIIISKTLLVPDMILGMLSSIKNLSIELMKMHPVKIQFEKENIGEQDLDKKMQANIFRIVHEQLSYILNHTGATRIIIGLTELDNKIVLSISDNGQNSDINERKNGIDFRNIIGRAELYNGNAAVEPISGEGYVLKVILPSDSNLKGE